jgi:uncharacterized protein YpbB
VLGINQRISTIQGIFIQEKTFTTFKEIKLLIKKISHKETPGRDGFTGEFY